MKKDQWLVSSLIAAVLGIATAAWLIRNSGDDLMIHCRQFNQEQIEEQITTLMSDRLIVATGNLKGSVDIYITPEFEEEALLVVLSSKLLSQVYRGPYQPKIRIDIDSQFLKFDGHDNLQFLLILPSKSMRCNWANERGYPWWTPGAIINVGLRSVGEFDSDGLLEDHDVTISR